MEDTELYARLTRILREVFDDDGLVARPELSADDVDDWDSLSNLRLVMTVEKAFDVKFAAAEIGALMNIGDLANLIRSKF